MEDDLRQVLLACWSGDDSQEVDGVCRWCRFEVAGEHKDECPCHALSRALDQRDALTGLLKAEKHYMRMQGVARSARKAGRAGAQRRLDEAAHELEKALARVRKLDLEKWLA